MPVSLGVFDRREMLFGVEPGDEVLETLISELCLVVSDERLWYLELRKYVFVIQWEN